MAFNGIPFECVELTKFEADDIRNLVNQPESARASLLASLSDQRPKYERIIMTAALQGESSAELVYGHKPLAQTVMARLLIFGFTVDKIKSRAGERREFYFKVNW